MPRKRRYEEAKETSLFARLTPQAKQGLQDRAAELKLSLAEFLELLGQGKLSIVSIGSASLQGELSAS
jgi:hypothetical protein